MAKRATTTAKDRVNARTRTRPKAGAKPSSIVQADDDTSGPRSRKGQQTRERLVEAAKEIFEEHGFLNARISDIAERAAQSHGSFYYYFQSKEEIFREIAASVDELLFAALDDVVLKDTDRGPEPHERVREATRRHFESYRKSARIVDLIQQVARYDPEVRAMVLARHRRNTERVANTIRQMQRRKMVDPKLDATLAAAALGALTQRFAELWFVEEAIDCTFEQGVEQLTRIYENALRLNYAKKST